MVADPDFRSSKPIPPQTTRTIAGLAAPVAENRNTPLEMPRWVLIHRGFIFNPVPMFQKPIQPLPNT
jgi:hypothetical protein